VKAFVSGATGLVGRYIVEDLLAAGYGVRIGGRSKPAGDLFSKPVEFSEFGLGAGEDPAPLFTDVNCFIHAAFDHVPGRYRGGEGDDPDAFRTRNLDGSVLLFEAARRAGVRRAVFLSSRAVYDGAAPGTVQTERLHLRPTSLYGDIKLKCEQALAALNGPAFTTASLRLTGVYGGLRPNKWDRLVADYLAGATIPVRAGSEVHGSDVGQAVRLMLETEPPLVAGEAFNVSDLIADTHEILSAIKELSGNPHPLPDRADKAAIAAMDCAKIRALGWKPGGMPLFEKTLRQLAAGQASGDRPAGS